MCLRSALYFGRFTEMVTPYQKRMPVVLVSDSGDSAAKVVDSMGHCQVETKAMGVATGRRSTPVAKGISA